MERQESKQFIYCDWQIAYTPAGRMEYRIGDCRRRSNDTDFAHTLDTERRNFRIRLIYEDHIDILNIGMGRDMILAQVMIHEATEAIIHHRLFMQCHTKPPDNATDDLATRRLGIQNTPGRYRTYDSRHAVHTEILVYPHLREHGAVRMT